MNSSTLDLGSLAEITDPEEAQPAGSRFSAALYDPMLALGERIGMRRRRRELLADARGTVLEIGAGTGLNLDQYPEGLEALILTEPVAPMAAKLRRRAERSDRDVQVIEAPADRLPLEDASVDTVVSTMVLCTVPDPDAALAEVRRVLKPGGRLLFCEHVRSDSPRLSRWQRRLAGAWAAWAEGCRCDQPTLELIGRRMEVASTRSERWRGMPVLVRPLVIGQAVR